MKQFDTSNTSIPFPKARKMMSNIPDLSQHMSQINAMTNMKQVMAEKAIMEVSTSIYMELMKEAEDFSPASLRKFAQVAKTRALFLIEAFGLVKIDVPETEVTEPEVTQEEKDEHI